jgi:hypothetical protein
MDSILIKKIKILIFNKFKVLFFVMIRKMIVDQLKVKLDKELDHNQHGKKKMNF